MERFAPRTGTNFQERTFYQGLGWADRILRWVSGGISPQTVVLQRRQIIDFLVEEKIRSGIDQIVEIGCGFSERGLRMTEKYGHITYADTDLGPVLEQRMWRGWDQNAPASHKLLVVNALLKEGPYSIQDDLGPFISQQKPVLFVVEGLANFLEGSDLRRLWENIFRYLSCGAGGVFVSDYLLIEHSLGHSSVRSFSRIWNQVLSQKIHFHLPSVGELRQTLLNIGFDAVSTYSPKEFYNILQIPRFKSGDLLTVVEASITPGYQFDPLHPNPINRSQN